MISNWVRAHQPAVMLTGAVAGFAAGLLIWGYLTMSVIGGIDSLLGETEPRLTAAESAQTEVFDCASFGAVRALSSEDEARFQAQCGVSAPVSTDAPPPAPAAPVSAPQSPAATAGNRASCDEIRGTDYWSGEERTWYLDNCVSS